MKYYLSRLHRSIHVTDEAHKDDLLFNAYPVVIETEKLEDLISVLGFHPDEFCDCAGNLGFNTTKDGR